MTYSVYIPISILIHLPNPYSVLNNIFISNLTIYQQPTSLHSAVSASGLDFRYLTFFFHINFFTAVKEKGFDKETAQKRNILIGRQGMVVSEYLNTYWGYE